VRQPGQGEADGSVSVNVIGLLKEPVKQKAQKPNEWGRSSSSGDRGTGGERPILFFFGSKVDPHVRVDGRRRFFDQQHGGWQM